MTRFASAAAVAAAVVASIQPVSAQRGPAMAESGLRAEVIALACAPLATFEDPAASMRITGGQDAFTKRNYTPGDLVTINAGTANGIEVGQQFFARRMQRAREEQHATDRPGTIRTTGWLRVYAVDDHLSLATITHACDAIEVGDYLEPFVAPEPAIARADKPKAERDHYARVLPGADLRRSFGKGDFFVINHGSNDGVTPGAQFVVFRDKHEKDNFLYELGEAVAVSVSPQVSTLQVTLARDAFSDGDLVAQRK
jgi:hypothetical protein